MATDERKGGASTTQSLTDLARYEEESQEQQLPKQGKVFAVPEKMRQRVHNLPDPTRVPLGYDAHATVKEDGEKKVVGKGFDAVFPWIRLPALHPANHGDTVIFNAPEAEPNALYLGDNLHVLRSLPSESIDLIYIDPPFFSGRNYNVIWGDSNEVRSFGDIWEGGIDSYLIWLNARLWEMKRCLKKTGSIYVHCDWHASHYIKCEMDKIFGYENFRNEIVWYYPAVGNAQSDFARKHDVIFRYAKSGSWIFNIDEVRDPYDEKTLKRYKKAVVFPGGYEARANPLGKIPVDVWQIPPVRNVSAEQIGYPTQKPEALLERVIKASSSSREEKVERAAEDLYKKRGGRQDFKKLSTSEKEQWIEKIDVADFRSDIVADFFCGGGTTLAVAQKLKRRFIGCDSSRIAVAVTLDRLVKIGEEMSGVKSNLSAEMQQQKIQMDQTTEKVPNIEVKYLGVYPIDKFAELPHEQFVEFVLTCYGAHRNTADGVTDGFRAPGQSEPILVGPSNSDESVDAKRVKAFFDEIKQRLEQDKPINGRVIGWRFSKQVQQYVEQLQEYVATNRLMADDGVTPLITIELIELRSARFRRHILARYPNAEDADFFLRFPVPPIIGDIRVKKVKDLEYEFEAMDAMPMEEGGWLVNCQWDFDYQDGHFAADKDYILSREKPKGQSGRFQALLTGKHTFDHAGEFVVACKVQDNLAGESIRIVKIQTS